MSNNKQFQLDLIREVVGEINHPTIHKSRQARLQEYVDMFGIKIVAAAGGLKESSLKTYLRQHKPRIDAGMLTQVQLVLTDERVMEVLEVNET